MVKDTIGVLFWNDAYQMGEKDEQNIESKNILHKVRKNAMGQTLFETSLISQDIFECLDKDTYRYGRNTPLWSLKIWNLLINQKIKMFNWCRNDFLISLLVSDFQRSSFPSISVAVLGFSSPWITLLTKGPSINVVGPFFKIYDPLLPLVGSAY